MSLNTIAGDSERFRRAQASWKRGDIAATETLLREILASSPAHAEAATLLAKLLQSQGRLGAASEVMAALFRRCMDDARITLGCAQFIRQCQRQRLAATLCEEAFAAGSSGADLRALAGNVYRELGEFTCARTHLVAAIERGVDLDVWFALGTLAGVQRYDSAQHPDITRLEAHFHGARGSARARATSGFGLAKACDDLGDHAQAAAVLREANALARSDLPWSGDAWQRWVNDRVQASIAVSRPPSPCAFNPIFVVGLPRSGTTLTALQLSRQADAVERGELPHIPYIAARLDSSGCKDDPEALREAAQLYRVHVVQDDAPARWYIDNNQMNFRHLNLIARLFPQARVIHCVRGRRDTALSIYSQYFAHADCAFANDFHDIAAFVAGHDRLMQHWKQRLDLPILTVAYEDLVEDAEAQGARLRAFCGMAPAAGVAAPAREGVITSASMWQARQPVYRSSVERWRAYAPYLPQLEQLFAAT